MKKKPATRTCKTMCIIDKNVIDNSDKPHESSWNVDEQMINDKKCLIVKKSVIIGVGIETKNKNVAKKTMKTLRKYAKQTKLFTKEELEILEECLIIKYDEFMKYGQRKE